MSGFDGAFADFCQELELAIKDVFVGWVIRQDNNITVLLSDGNTYKLTVEKG